MFKEIQTIYLDSTVMMNEIHSGMSLGKKDSEYYREGVSLTIRLDTIKQLRKETSADSSMSYYRLKVSDDYHDDILVSEEQGEKIKEALLKTKEPIATELSILSTAIHNMYELLRARLH